MLERKETMEKDCVKGYYGPSLERLQSLLSHLAAPDCKEPWEGRFITMNEGVKTFGGE